MTLNWKDIIQFLKFCAVGLTNTIIGYVVYSACVYFGMHYLLANVVGFIVSVINAFYWSNKYVFKKESNEYRNNYTSFIKTILSYASTGIILNSIMLWLLIDEIHISEYIAPIIILLITVPTNYIMNKYWSFRTIKQYDEED